MAEQTSQGPKKTSRPAILGATYPATVKGFGAFIAKANEADTIGYELMTLVKVETKLAAVWKLRGGLPPDSPYDSFLGEEDEDPVANHGW